MNVYCNIDEVKRKLSAWLHIIDKIEQLNIQIVNKIEIDTNNPLEAYSMAIYLKIIESIEASYELINNGYLESSKNTLRSSLEGLFILRALRIDNSRLSLLAKDSDNSRRKFYNAIMKSVHTEKIKKIINEDMITPPEKKDCIEINVAKWSDLAELRDFYDYVYRVLSNESHHNLKSFNKYLEIDADLNLKNIKVEPDYEEIDRLVFTLFSIELYTLYDLNLIFNLRKKTIINKIFGDFKRHHKTLKDFT